MPRSRLANLLVAVGAGAVFVAGLFADGVLGALLLVAVAGFLVLLSASAWPTIPGRGRRVRVLVVLLVLVAAAVKLAEG
jgi:hypothetical protein